MVDDDKKTEQEFLQLANDAQEKFNELNNKLQDSEEELLYLKKELISCYGYIRILDNVYKNQIEVEPTVSLMLDVLREFLSQFTENNIL